MNTNTGDYDHLGSVYLWFEIDLRIVDLELHPHALADSSDRETLTTSQVYLALQDKIARELKWTMLSFMQLDEANSGPQGDGATVRRFVTIWKLPTLEAGQAFIKGDQLIGTWSEYSLLFPHITHRKERLLQPALFNPRRVLAYGERPGEEDSPVPSYEQTFPFQEDLIIATQAAERQELAYLPKYRYAGTPVTETAPGEVKYLVHQGVSVAKIPARYMPDGAGPCYVVNLASLKRRTDRS